MSAPTSPAATDCVQNVTILGATGSIGTSTLDVLARHPQRYRIFALSARSRLDALLALCQQFRPALVAVPEAAASDFARQLREAGLKTEVCAGERGLCDIAAHEQTHVVMAAIVGAAGLPPVLAAACAGKRILLANKESLVMGGQLVLDAVRRHGATLLPVDSEHSAIFQCLPAGARIGEEAPGLRRIILTASGGPFRSLAASEFAHITPEQACAHPTWAMGRKISVDSATMMNKGLEVIEARWLFDLPGERIEAIIHPQSVVHSLVEYVDGSLLAQLGQPDMRTPIACALAWPQRVEAGVASLDFTRLAALEFHAPDTVRFPCLRLAYEALAAGGTAPTILNAANEVAVEAFLARRLPFTGIAETIAQVLETLPTTPADSLDALQEADARARETARQHLQQTP